jgi:predicted dehydrogenase
MTRKLRIALSGIGNRALPKNPANSNWIGWIELIKNTGLFELVAAHDVSEDSKKRIVERGYLKAEQTYTDLDDMLDNVSCDALLVANPAEYHAQTIRKALDHDLNLLVEKPFVTSLSEGKELAQLIKKKDRKVAVVQNWRTKDVGQLLRKSIQEGLLGRMGHVFFRYVRDRENPNYPKYILEEEYPLLYAMGIHHLDLFRYVLNDDYKTVTGRAFKPPWSLYKSETGLNLLFETVKGVTVVYTGTISSKNASLPQESLIIEGEKGTLVNESQWLEPPLWFYPKGEKTPIDLAKEITNRSIPEQYNISDKLVLTNFYNAITLEEDLICSAQDGLRSIASLEASRSACETGKTIEIGKI